MFWVSVLIRDSGLTESFDPGLDSSQLCDSWQASGHSRQASVAVCEYHKPFHTLSLDSS
jgi:hypothetical protein